ncbi:glycosyl hydrolase family 71-domain-containing protein [Mycena capillaripes]|nr:glycosyl hydrolase family 71-domain-containing protein [Mycena capillaripes]
MCQIGHIRVTFKRAIQYFDASLQSTLSFIWLPLFVSTVVSTPPLGSLFGSESDKSAPLESPAEPVASSKLVVAHVIVENTLKYDTADCIDQIDLAASKGFDAFAVNDGLDDWQAEQVRRTFVAAQRFNNFNLFVSFDMNVIPCSATNDAIRLRGLLDRVKDSTRYQQIEGKPLVSAFSGQGCTFG